MPEFIRGRLTNNTAAAVLLVEPSGLRIWWWSREVGRASVVDGIPRRGSGIMAPLRGQMVVMLAGWADVCPLYSGPWAATT